MLFLAQSKRSLGRAALAGSLTLMAIWTCNPMFSLFILTSARTALNGFLIMMTAQRLILSHGYFCLCVPGSHHSRHERGTSGMFWQTEKHERRASITTERIDDGVVLPAIVDRQRSRHGYSKGCVGTRRPLSGWHRSSRRAIIAP